MTMTCGFSEASAPPATLRHAYLSGLREPQEFYLEQLVSTGKTWRYDDRCYAVVNDRRLVEFFTATVHTGYAAEFLEHIMELSGATEILCKSFDRQLLSAALARSADIAVHGFLFRRFTSAPCALKQEIAVRQASRDDVRAVAPLNDGFFSGNEEIAAYAEAGQLFVLQVGQEIVGCGITNPLFADRPEVDIGMWIAPNHRGNGYGAYLVDWLKHHCLRQAGRPICGCGVDNIASYRTLMRGGFASDHQILRITWHT